MAFIYFLIGLSVAISLIMSIDVIVAMIGKRMGFVIELDWPLRFLCIWLIVFINFVDKFKTANLSTLEEYVAESKQEKFRGDNNDQE